MVELSNLISRLEDIELQDAEPALNRSSIDRAVPSLKSGTNKELMETLKISELEREKVALILEILDHPQFVELVDLGHITFGMVKPKVNEAKRRDLQDSEVADRIMAEISPPLDLIIAQDFWLSLDRSATFYGHLATRPEIFERVKRDMSKGAVTGLILFNHQGSAISAWRDQIGPTNPQSGSPQQIRRKFAEVIENNVVHGSDSVESVKRELEIFKEILRELAI